MNLTGLVGLLVGTTGDNGPLLRHQVITGAGGALNINNASANLVLNQGTGTNANPGGFAQLDLSGLDTFTANMSGLGLGSVHFTNAVAQRNAGTLYLAKTNTLTLNYAQSLANYLSNAAVTNSLKIGNYGSGNPQGVASQLFLGLTNVFYVDSIGSGKCKSSATSPAVIQFNPNFQSQGAVAYFRGLGGANSRVTWWGIGDMANNGSSAQSSISTNDFTGGTVDARVETMSLGRDTTAAQTSSSAVNRGVLTFTDGTIDVNTLFVGHEAFAVAANTVPSIGIVNLNAAGATLVVNSNLTLGFTTVSSTAAQKTTGTLNVSGGTLIANNISVGAVSGVNSITVNNSGILILSNNLASSARALTTLTANSGTLQLTLGLATQNITVTNLVTGNPNVINLSSPVLTAYPTQFTLIKYSGAIQGSGFNFTLGTVPPHIIGNLVDNSFNSSVDFQVTTDPRPAIAATNEPLSQLVAPGSTVILTVTPNGTSPFGFQWQKGAAALTDGGTGSGSTISGSATGTLEIDNIQAADEADYTCVVTNAYGSITSSVAHVTVTAGPKRPPFRSSRRTPRPRRARTPTSPSSPPAIRRRLTSGSATGSTSPTATRAMARPSTARKPPRSPSAPRRPMTRAFTAWA